jgi:hypothetical protein
VPFEVSIAILNHIADSRLVLLNNWRKPVRISGPTPFDGTLEDVFDLQDKVASSVAGVIEPELQAAETAGSASRRTSNLSAYDLYLRAHAMSFTYQLRQALALLEEAIARDPHYGPALGLAVANL